MYEDDTSFSVRTYSTLEIDTLHVYICSFWLVKLFTHHTYITLPLYRKAHSEAAINWLGMILNTELPVLICLTFGDKLFAESMPGYHQHPKDEEANAVIQQELRVSRCVSAWQR